MKASASPSTKSRRPKGRAPATFAAKTEALASILILFDIDGTLVLTGGAGGRAMARAFEDLYGVRDAFSGVPFNGRTDAWIIAQAAAAHGIAAPDLAKFKPLYLQYLADELPQPGPRKGIMPGVRELL